MAAQAAHRSCRTLAGMVLKWTNYRLIFAFSAVLLFQSPLYAHPENEPPCPVGKIAQIERASAKRRVSTSHRTIVHDLENKILPFLEKHQVDGYFEGTGGTKIHYAKFIHPTPKGTVVLSHGFRESIEVNRELIYNLYENGYSVYIHEHRGHGSSERLALNPKIIHVDKFGDYVKDLETFVHSVVKADHPDGEKLHMVGNSMGGLIASLFAKAHPESIESISLVAPMMQVDLHGLPESLVPWVTGTANLVGYKDSYAFGQNDNTKGPYPAMARKVPELQGVPMGGASFNWVREAVSASKTGRQIGKDLNLPVLVIDAGDDHVVRKNGTDHFCEGVANCTRVTFNHGTHALLRENDPVRDPVMNNLIDFLDAHATSAN